MQKPTSAVWQTKVCAKGKLNINFLTLLQFRAKTDRVLAGHLNSDESRAIPKYTSPDIQNEFIELCGDYIRKLLLRDCNNAHSFAFLADEATDSGAKEQISICIRFVQRKEGENKEEVREDFLGFVEAESTKGVALTEKFMTPLLSLELTSIKCEHKDVTVLQIFQEYTGKYRPSYGNRYQR